MEAKLHSTLSSALDEDEQIALPPNPAFYPEEEQAPVTTEYVARVGLRTGLETLVGNRNILSLPEIKPRSSTQ